MVESGEMAFEKYLKTGCSRYEESPHSEQFVAKSENGKPLKKKNEI
jgi:hypothetical protein